MRYFKIRAIHRYLVFPALLVLIADQITKYLVVKNLFLGESIPIIPSFFNLVLVYNKGVAFGVFSEISSDAYRYAVLALTTLVALIAVGFFARQEQYQQPLSLMAIGLVFGGAIGNLIDRIRVGAVTDFLDFQAGSYHWPAFNIADSAICIAVGILFFIAQRKKPNGANPPKTVLSKNMSNWSAFALSLRCKTQALTATYEKVMSLRAWALRLD